MEALTAAIRQGLNPTAASSRSLTPKPFSEVSGVRMPFQGEEPSSPSSVYTDATFANKRYSAPLSSYQGYDQTPSTLVEQEASDYDKSQYHNDLPTPMSTHPIIAAVGPGMSSKIPAGRRPLRLDMGAVRDAEARGSMTSLSDLIKRATRLASNLDRGKTASRLGHLDMFGSSDKLGNRNSTYSDVLDAFPPPAHGSSTPNGRPTTLWPNGDKQFMASKSSLGRFMDTNEKAKASEKPRRKCCGMSPIVFVFLMIVLVLLVAAAVLVPVFLLVLPKQHHGVDPASCRSSHLCQNGGYSVSANDVCSCVCVDGFTGSDCSTEKDPECITASISDGVTTTYDNATVGSSILPLLQNAQTSFAISLNTTQLLSRFAYNNLSCASENSLVDFGATHSNQVKRFVIVPGMMSTEPHVPVLNLPHSESKQNPRFVIAEGLPDTDEELPLLPTHTLEPRQDATQSANGIVFATSSGGLSGPTATAASGTSTSTATSSTSSQTTKINATENQLGFAATVVLYVLETSSQISDAVTANQVILAHFQETNPVNSTVVVKEGKDGMQADFQNFQIKFSNGTTVGGGGSAKDGS